MGTFIRVSFLLFFTCLTAFAQVGQIEGTVTDSRTEKGIENVLVQIQGTEFSTTTTRYGEFKFNRVKEGEYYLLFSKKGYYTLVYPDVKVEQNKKFIIRIEMVVGDEKEYLFMEIGGITVTADRELLSVEPETIHKITKGEIEHMQANSLANVLSLIPGNIQTTAPGLQSQQKISIRTFENAGDDKGAMFGTKVIVDDIPLSNNADLQTGEGVNYGTGVQSTSNTQYDLREVVAENLEKVEVVAGGSSVEYGDLSQGLILAQTRVRNVPTRFKFKNNPDTREANLMGSFDIGETGLVYNLNYGYSERDIRVDGDEYHRISADLKSRNSFLDNTLGVLQIFKYGRKIEEDNDESDPYSTKAYNRDHHFTYSHQFDYKINEVSGFYVRNYVDYKIRNSWKKKLETPDLAIWTDLMEPGTREGIIPETATYFSEVSTRGNEWSYGTKLKYNRNWLSGNTLHRFLLGAEFQTDDNTGPGKSYDLLKPPNGRTSTRPRSFSDTPGITQVSFFGEDRVTGTLGLPYSFNFGFRIDTYNPTEFNPGKGIRGGDVFSSGQGTFFNPRAGLKLTVSPSTQVRFSFNRNSKIPSIADIYPEDYFLDVFDESYRIVTDTSGNLTIQPITLVSTYQFQRSSPNLKGYQSTQYEVALDQEIGNVGFSLLAYYQYTDGMPVGVEIPFTYYRYFWPEWGTTPGDTTGKLVLETISTTESKYNVAKNKRKSQSSGFEIGLNSHRIKSLNMRFKVNASFNFKKYSSAAYNIYGNARNFSIGDTLPNGAITDHDTYVIPIFRPNSSWRQRMVVHYFVDYIAKPLGIWLTFKAQHVLLEQDLDIINPKLEASSYYSEGNVYELDAETSDKYGLSRTYQENSVKTDKSKPNDQWMFSIVVSKSLYKGAEVSLYVDNIFNDRAYYKNRDGFWSARNHEIFWGISFSTKVDGLFR